MIHKYLFVIVIKHIESEIEELISLNLGSVEQHVSAHHFLKEKLGKCCWASTEVTQQNVATASEPLNAERKVVWSVSCDVWQLQSPVTFQIKISHENRVSGRSSCCLFHHRYLFCPVVLQPVTVRVKDTGSKQVKSAFKMQPLIISSLNCWK